MNIDQRLEKLVERHEALTQSVEMLATDLRELKTLVSDIAEGTARLLHERRRSPRTAHQRLGSRKSNSAVTITGRVGGVLATHPLSPNRHSRVVDHRGDVEASTA